MRSDTAPVEDSLAHAMVALQPRLRRFALGLTHSLDEADDLVQSAYERALARRHQYRPGSRLDSWMFRIVHTSFLNQREHAGVRARYASDADPDDQSAGDGCAALDASLTLDRVHDCLERIPDAQRAALLLVAVEGLSYAEAAEALEVPVGTLTSRLGRARAALADQLHGARRPQTEKSLT